MQHPLQPCLAQIPWLNGTRADLCSLPWCTACLAAHPARAAISSSLDGLADPGASCTGCIQLFSQLHREMTVATPLATVPRTRLRGTLAGVDRGLLNCLCTACLAAHPATAATISSLGSLADPGASRSGYIRLFSHLTGAVPLVTILVQLPWGNGT